MSRTLFWYIFKDLFRIFMMASGALAGIMSFGGLLRPLTHQGLDLGQVGQVLTFFGPAMTTYSFPIAALFATTVVYGRLSADNELTACRAGGMSLMSLTVAGPALVLGLVVAVVSLLFLCFVVPTCTLKVEKVLYSNLAKLVTTRIQRNHEIPFGEATIYAQDAYLPPADTVPPGQQQVVLLGPTIVTVERPIPGERDYRVPKEFMTAGQALVYISQRPDDEQVDLTVRLIRGFKFPRKFLGAMQAGIEETECGPILIPSPIKEDTKFMNVWRLKALYERPGDSRKIRNMISDLVRRDQEFTFLGSIAARLNGPEHRAVFEIENGERYVITRDASAPAAALEHDSMRIKARPGNQTRPVSFIRQRTSQPETLVRAADLTLKALPSSDEAQIDCSVTLNDCMSQTEEGVIPRANFTQHFSVPMEADVAAIADRGLAFYAQQPNYEYVRRELRQLLNEIWAESNARASFAVSCLILVMVGCALGMIFRSGNFLTAFAVSFIPALLSITLIIAGQRTAGSIATHDLKPYTDPLQLGLGLIWAGNGVNLAIASVLMWRLHRK